MLTVFLKINHAVEIPPKTNMFALILQQHKYDLI